MHLSTRNSHSDDTTDDMQNGVRALMLDTYDFKGDVWLCHSNGGKCNDFTAFVSILKMLDSCRMLTEGVQIAVFYDTSGHCRNQHWTPSRKLRRFFHPIHLKSSQ